MFLPSYLDFVTLASSILSHGKATTRQHCSLHRQETTMQLEFLTLTFHRVLFTLCGLYKKEIEIIKKEKKNKRLVIWCAMRNI